MKEKPIFHLTKDNVANLTDEQLKEILFDDRFKITGSISQFAKDAPERYKAAKTLKGLGRVQEQQPAEEVVDPVVLAEAVTKFPKDRCIRLFKTESGTPGAEVAANLDKSDYRLAQIAAKHFSVIPAKGGAEVRVNFQTPAERKTLRERREVVQKIEQFKQEGRDEHGLPPGISPDPQSPGNYLVTDTAAYEAWKKRQDDLKAAREIIAAVAS